MDDRGVSEVLAVLLTTVIVVALIAIVAVPALDGIRPEGHQTHITASVTTTDGDPDVTVTVTNFGGRTVDLSTADLIATTGGDRHAFEPMEKAHLVSGDTDDSFEEGERWRRTVEISGVEIGENVRVFLIVDGRAVGSWEGTVSAG